MLSDLVSEMLDALPLKKTIAKPQYRRPIKPAEYAKFLDLVFEVSRSLHNEDIGRHLELDDIGSTGRPKGDPVLGTKKAHNSLKISEMVYQARKDGFPVCADATGIYLARFKREIYSSLAADLRTALKMLRRYEALQKAAHEMFDCVEDGSEDGSEHEMAMSEMSTLDNRSDLESV